MLGIEPEVGLLQARQVDKAPPHGLGNPVANRSRPVDRRYRQAALYAQHSQLVFDGHVQIRRFRLHHQPVHAAQRGEVNIVERARKPPRGRIGRHDLEHIADIGIAEVMNPGWPCHVRHHLEIAFQVAATAQLDRLGGRQHDVAQRQHPGHALRSQGRQPILGELDPHHLSVTGGNYRKLARQRIKRVRLRRRRDARDRVEHHPYRVTAAEHGSGRVLLKGKHHPNGGAQYTDKGGDRLARRLRKQHTNQRIARRPMLVACRRLVGHAIGQARRVKAGQADARDVDIQNVLSGRRFVETRLDALRQLQRDRRTVRIDRRFNRNKLRRQIDRQIAQVDPHRPLKADHSRVAILHIGATRGHVPVELHPQEGWVAPDAYTGLRLAQSRRPPCAPVRRG